MPLYTVTTPDGILSAQQREPRNPIEKRPLVLKRRNERRNRSAKYSLVNVSDKTQLVIAPSPSAPRI